MGAISSTGFSCAEALKALADPTRLAIVRQLMIESKYVHQINEELDVEQTLLSHHLKVLREAGIVESQRDGKAMLYRLSSQVEANRKGNALELGCCRLVFDA